MFTARARTSFNLLNAGIPTIQFHARPQSGRLQNLLQLLLLAVLAAAISAPSARAQGFGNGKKHVTLHRRLPAAVKLPGAAFDVQVNAHDATNSDVAQSLSDLIPIEIRKERQESARGEKLRRTK